MKKIVLQCLALVGAFLANISLADPNFNALQDGGNLNRIEPTGRDTKNPNTVLSKQLIKNVQCEIAENESYSRCRSTCSASGISNYTPGVCGVGAKCTCVATVENPPGG